MELFRERVSPFIRNHIASLDSTAAAALRLQFEPDSREYEPAPGFADDPLSEEHSDIHPLVDVIHKYPTKILYLTTDECPVYCRYCTRKRKTLMSDGHAMSSPELVATYLAKHTQVNEVIFSGGDPLMLSASDFFERAQFFLNLASIQYLRLHTRAITTAPNLLSEKWVDVFTELKKLYPKKSVAMVLHINTAAEISDAARSKIELLKLLSIPLYSQTVLLRHVNDNAASLAELCRALVRAGVQPYYLHQLDRVTGAAHFEVPDGEARAIYLELKMLIPKTMLPELVRDSKQGKKPL